MAIKRIEALGLAEILGSLLGSVVDAQARSSRATVDFIDEVGFETGAEGEGEKMRTIKLRYRKKNEDGTPADFEVEVPLLAMVNVPALVVREAKLSFSYDVVGAEEEKPTQGGSTGGALPGMKTLKKANLSGFIKSKKSGAAAERYTTSIDLDITLEQQELPIGVERLFDLAEMGITETQIKKDEAGGG